MEVNPIIIILAAITILVPVILIFLGQELWLLAWICFTAGLNILDVRILLNLPAARIAGLLLLPQTFLSLRWVVRSYVGKALIAQYTFLVLTGVFFGFLFPWEADCLIREFNQLPEGRTIIWLIRTLADVSLSVFIAQQVIKSKGSEQILKYFVIGTSIAALGGIFEFVSRVDLVEVITGLGYNNDGFRVRGLCFEPRDLGLLTLYGLLFSVLLYSYESTKSKLLAIILNLTGFLISGSTSAYVAFIFGALALGLYHNRACALLIKMSLVVICIIACLFVYFESQLLDFFICSIDERLSGRRFDEAQNFLELIVFKMEIFDGPAILFLWDNPIYLLTGTGPGLIGIPATPYMPKSAAYAWLEFTGINNPPTMGLLLNVANMGVIGLLLLIYLCWASLHALGCLALYHPDKTEEWLMTRGAFATGAAVYMVQVSGLSPIWPILIGIGLGADYLVQVDRYRNEVTPI